MKDIISKGAQQVPLGKFNIIVGYRERSSDDVLNDVTYTLKQDLLIVHKGEDDRLVPLYGVEHVRIIRRTEDTDT